MSIVAGDAALATRQLTHRAGSAHSGATTMNLYFSANGCAAGSAGPGLFSQDGYQQQSCITQHIAAPWTSAPHKLARCPHTAQAYSITAADAKQATRKAEDSLYSLAMISLLAPPSSETAQLCRCRRGRGRRPPPGAPRSYSRTEGSTCRTAPPAGSPASAGTGAPPATRHTPYQPLHGRGIGVPACTASIAWIFPGAAQHNVCGK